MIDMTNIGKNLRISVLIILLSAIGFDSYAAQSVILDTDGYSCMGDDKSRKQTEDIAFKEAKRKASETATTYIQSETHLKDALLEKEIISAYTNSRIKVIQELQKEWYKETSLGDCYRVKLKVEVIPDEQGMNKAVNKKAHELFDDSVKVFILPQSSKTDSETTELEQQHIGLKETIYTNKTNLMWARNGNIAGKQMNWSDAMNWTKNLNYGGYTDWRLPSKDEFEAFAKKGGEKPLDWYNANGFNNAQAGFYWTSSNYVINSSDAWVVSMYNGLVGYYYKANYYYVWPVRDGN
jgi:hypothetical protein